MFTEIELFEFTIIKILWAAIKKEKLLSLQLVCENRVCLSDLIFNFLHAAAS
jgi:hypothetical protein